MTYSDFLWEFDPLATNDTIEENTVDFKIIDFKIIMISAKKWNQNHEIKIMKSKDEIMKSWNQLFFKKSEIMKSTFFRKKWHQKSWNQQLESEIMKKNNEIMKSKIMKSMFFQQKMKSGIMKSKNEIKKWNQKWNQIKFEIKK